MNEHTQTNPPALAEDRITLTPQQAKSRQARNTAIGLAVAFFAILFYAVTIVKLGPGVLHPPE